MEILVGTSGWNYDCFVGILYPVGTPKRKYLETYTRRLKTVELNASFYRSFPDSTWHGWYKRTPDGFLWSVKASRYLTHIKRLAVTPEEVERFWKSASLLKEKLAVSLFQLPPNLAYDRGLLISFLDLQPPDRKIALEARHPSWHQEEIWQILKERNTAWVVSHFPGKYPMSSVVTADFAYLRLHGTTGPYTGEYGPDRLRKWLEQIRNWDVKRAYVYFDNTADGSAAKDALTMLGLL